MFEQVFNEKSIKEYIKNEPEMTLFIFGDLENYGTHNDNCRFYFNYESKEIDCLILVYNLENFCVYSQKKQPNIDEIILFLKTNYFKVLSGKEELIELIFIRLTNCELKKTMLARCNEAKPIMIEQNIDDICIKRLTKKAELKDNILLVNSIIEFTDTKIKKSLEEQILEVEERIKRGDVLLGLYIGETLVSVAATTSSSSQSAMVVSVATRKEYRNQGYGSLAVNELCKAAFKDGLKFLCLFYNNPKAARIYKRIGFVDVGQYGMIINIK